MNLRQIAVLASTVIVLAACGGGGSNGSVGGVVSGGAPIVGVVVTVTDSNGHTATSAPTDANGNYSVGVNGLTPPFIFTAPFIDNDGTPGAVSSVLAFGGAANLNPLTSLIAQRVLGAYISTAPSASLVIGAQLTTSGVPVAIDNVLTTLQPLFAGLNLPGSQSNPVTASMVANPSVDALDNLIDVTHILVHAGTLVVGKDANRVVVHIPPTGAMDGPGVITTAAIQSLQAQLAAGTATPITNVIVIVGENQTFDSLFGGYQAPTGQTVRNLLALGIINADGTPGPNFSLAAQSQGQTLTAYSASPTRAGPFATLPQPFLTGILEPTLTYAPNAPDPRFPATLPNGPFQITKYVPYVPTATTPSNTGDPVHRFFQMWQQTGGDNSLIDMQVWPAVTTGQGGGTTGITASNPGQGGELMGFVNMSAGDAQYFKSLAAQYAISDNFHQGILGGTGMNFFAIATGDLPYFNTNGQVAAPPANQIENPNPTSGTPNFYQNDGYEGGSYVNCSDTTQPGVAAVMAVLAAKGSPSNCDSGKYYLVNNYSPGYSLTGSPQPIGPNNFNYPPQTVPTIAEALAKKGVSWRWYTGARNPADVTGDAATYGVPVAVAQGAQYNVLGDPLVASTNIVTNPALFGRLGGLTDFSTDLAGGTLPAVSFIVPKNLSSGHPGYSIDAAYEQFIGTIVAQVQANATLWAHTAIIVTTDEGGGHFDTGYIQNLDFFGNGPRIPLILVSPYARVGAIDHVYQDHSSMLKFIERNWRLPPLSGRSRDNLPNPVATSANLYQPVNGRSIGDLTTLFAF